MKYVVEMPELALLFEIAKWDVSHDVGCVTRRERDRSKTAVHLIVDVPGHSELTRLVPMVPS